MEQSRIALIAPIEANKDNLNWQTKTSPFIHLYEDEAIKCFSAWRRNGGWLKDINIYVLCSTKNKVSSSTQSKLKSLGVQYIESYDSMSQSYSSGFLNLPYCGKFFEDYVGMNEDVLIRIDLDMALLKPLPCQLFSNVSNATLIGQYDVNSLKDQRTSYPGILPFDTGFMISNKNSGFYHKWYEMCFSDEVLNSSEWKSIRQVLGDYYLEEFAVDYMNYNNIMPIMPIQKYQFGEGYSSIDNFSDDEIEHVYFCHEHMYIDKKFPWGYNSVAEHIKYLKRTRR